LKVSSNVQIAMQCFEDFGGQIPPLVARLAVTGGHCDCRECVPKFACSEVVTLV